MIGKMSLATTPVLASGHFADHRRLVTCALQFLGDVIALGVEHVVQRVHAVLVAILSGENRRPAGRADGIGAEAVGEANPPRPMRSMFGVC